MLVNVRGRSRLDARTRRALLAGALALTAVVAALAAAQAPARVSLQTTICGVGNGSTWTRAGSSGRDWVVVALDDKGQCKSAAQWLRQLSARLTARSGADTQALRLLGDACVLTKSALLAACRTENGGAGSVGIAVIGDPTRNPAARPYTNGRTSFPPLSGSSGSSGGPGPAAEGVPMPWSGGVDCRFPVTTRSAAWSFRLGDGTLLSGDTWTVRGAPGGSEASCRALRAIWPRLATTLGSRHAGSESFDAKSFTDGSFSCVASHDVAAPGGASFVSSPPVGACARVAFPGSGDYPILEQVAVFPRVEDATTPITRGEQADLYERMGAVRHAIDRFGIHAATAAAAAAVRLTALPPAGRPSTVSRPWSSHGVSVCGATASEHDPAFRVLGSSWTHGSEHGSSWQVAVDGGYPCELARGLFLPWLAGALSSAGSPPGAQLSRYGWHCTLQRAALIGVCHFIAHGNPLAGAIARPVPGNLTVGIRAAYTAGATRETLPNAVRAAS
jgi:uncharacterized protein (DUF736 family)